MTQSQVLLKNSAYSIDITASDSLSFSIEFDGLRIKQRDDDTGRMKTFILSWDNWHCMVNFVDFINHGYVKINKQPVKDDHFLK